MSTISLSGGFNESGIVYKHTGKIEKLQGLFGKFKAEILKNWWKRSSKKFLALIKTINYANLQHVLLQRRRPFS
jgi:hypothetical protein